MKSPRPRPWLAHCKSSIAYCLVGVVMLIATVAAVLLQGRVEWLVIFIDVFYWLVLAFQLYWSGCLPFFSNPEEKQQ